MRTPGGSTPIERLEVGDFVVARTEDGENAVAEVESVLSCGPTEVLRLTLDSDNELVVTAEHPLYVEGEGWTPAEEIEVGDRLATYGGEVEVLSVETPPEAVAVYNLTVGDPHTFFVGGDEIWQRYASFGGPLGSPGPLQHDPGKESGTRCRTGWTDNALEVPPCPKEGSTSRPGARP